MQYLTRIGKKEWAALAAILFVLVLIRVPGLGLPYHQDEWKNAEMVRMGAEGGLSAHPPLMEAIYHWSGAIFGAGNLRMMPLVFGVISALLLYFVVRRRAGIWAALIATGLYAVSSFSVLASLLLDMDGTILPTFFLAALYAYDRFRDSSTRASAVGWLGTTAAVFLLGFLIKLSFILVLGALVIDYALHEWRRLTRTTIVYGAFALLASLGVLTASLWAARHVIPSFDVQATIAHALWYVGFEGRGYMQIVIQTAKAMFYLSPLLLLAPIFLAKEGLKKSGIFFIYLGVGVVFYYILLDFSQGALDKYLMYAIAPLCAIAGIALDAGFTGMSRRDFVIGLLSGLAAIIAIVGVAFLPHSVMPLYPKTEWLSSILSGNWDILIPFTGGNGPLGFYMSFLVIAAGFGVSAALAIAALVFKQWQRAILVSLVVISAGFNAIFIEELIWGRINGSAPELLRSAVAYIEAEGSKPTITHADAGAYQLNLIGAYAGRFYAVPAYEEGHRALFAKHEGQYLVVDIPRLSEDRFYRQFFATCAATFHERSGAIDAYVYDCAGSDPYDIK